MKKGLLLLYIGLSVSGFSQTNFRFADSTAQWNVLRGISWDCITTFCFDQKTLVHNVSIDTVIDGKSYQSITVPPDPSWFSSSELGSKVFLRKDLTEKIFLRRYSDTTDFLIYDFAKQAGDTFTIDKPHDVGWYIHCDIDSVDTITLDKPRKRFFVRYNGYWYQDIWIEGIGSIKTYFLQPGTDFTIADGAVHTTICYFDADTLIYHDTIFESCLIDTVWNAIVEVNKSDFTFSPNPATTYLTIQLQQSPTSPMVFQLFDITGRMILQKQLTAQTNTVELSGVSKGMYLYSVLRQAQHDMERISGKLAIE